MNENCPALETFEDLLRLDPADPRRRHLDECPRCRARGIAFASFMRGGELPPGTRLEEARIELAASLEREIARGSQRAQGRSSERRPRPWEGLERFFRLLWKPAAGLAAVALVLLALRIAERPATAPEGRMAVRDASRAVSVAAPLRSELGPGGSIRLRWSPVAEADGYKVLLFSPGLQPIGEFEAGSDSMLTLASDRLAGIRPAGSVVFWRVAALRNGDTISLSAPAALRLP
jgi:hypothetical protein